MRKRIYISGPMRGQDFERTFDRFYGAEALLRNMGYDVVNPVKIAHTAPFLDRDEMLRLDKAYLSVCDAIYLLGGWERSEGCSLEVEWAREMKLEIMHEEPHIDPAWAFDRPNMGEKID